LGKPAPASNKKTSENRLVKEAVCYYLTLALHIKKLVVLIWGQSQKYLLGTSYVQSKKETRIELRLGINNKRCSTNWRKNG
jgi:hypothetical protein